MVRELTRERQMIKIQNLTKRKRVRIITVKKNHHDVSKKENIKNYITEHVLFLLVSCWMKLVFLPVRIFEDIVIKR